MSNRVKAMIVHFIWHIGVRNVFITVGFVIVIIFFKTVDNGNILCVYLITFMREKNKFFRKIQTSV